MQFCTTCNCHLKPFENLIEIGGKIEKHLWWRCSHPACTFRQKGGEKETLVFVRHYGNTITSKYNTEYEKEFYGYLTERHGNFHDFMALYPTVNPDFPIQCPITEDGGCGFTFMPKVDGLDIPPPENFNMLKFLILRMDEKSTKCPFDMHAYYVVTFGTLSICSLTTCHHRHLLHHHHPLIAIGRFPQEHFITLQETSLIRFPTLEERQRIRKLFHCKRLVAKLRLWRGWLVAIIFTLAKMAMPSLYLLEVDYQG